MIGADVMRAGTEIERKFLVRDTSVVRGWSGTMLRQGYFSRIDGWSVRLRTAAAEGGGDGGAWLTLKSRDSGHKRREIEAPVAEDFAQRLLDLLPPAQLIAKIRYRMPAPDGLAWEIDRFLGRHDGLWLAEIELPRTDYPLDLPAWLGAEVTDDPRYGNANLAASGGETAAPAELVAAARQLLGEAAAQRPAMEKPAPSVPAGGGGSWAELDASARAARLAAKLRANLGRRKQQMRARLDDGQEGPGAQSTRGAGPQGLDRDDPPA